MKEATKRSIVRWIHIVISIPIIGYIYSPFEEIPNYAPAVRYVFLPVMVAMSFDDSFQNGRPSAASSRERNKDAKTRNALLDDSVRVGNSG